MALDYQTLMGSSIDPINQQVEGNLQNPAIKNQYDSDKAILDNMENIGRTKSNLDPFFENSSLRQEALSRRGEGFVGEFYDETARDNEDYLSGSYITPNLLPKLDQVLYENQGTFKAIANGLTSRTLSIVPKIGNTLASALGLVGGIGNMAFNAIEAAMGDAEFDPDKAFQIAYDNALVNSMNEADEYLKKAFPVFGGDKYANENILSRMSTAKFWAEDIADGIAFTTSSMLTGAGVTGGLSKLGLLAKGSGAISATAATIVNTNGEAMLEANDAFKTIMQQKDKFMESKLMKDADVHNMVSIYDTQIKELLDKRFTTNPEELNLLNNQIDKLMSDREAYLKDTEKRYSDEFESLAAEAARMTYLGNVAILAGPNFIQSKLFNKILSQNADDVSKTLLKGIKDGTMKPSDISVTKEVLKGMGTQALTEGFWEENAQTALSTYLDERAFKKMTIGDDDINMISDFANTIAGTGEKMLSNVWGLTGDTEFGNFEGAMSIITGALSSAIFGAAGNYKQARKDIERAKFVEGKFRGINTLIGESANAYRDNVKGLLVEYGRDEQGNPIYEEIDNNGVVTKPLMVDFNKAAQILTHKMNEDRLLNSSALATIEDNNLQNDMLIDEELASTVYGLAATSMSAGVLTLDEVKEKFADALNTANPQDGTNNSFDQEVVQQRIDKANQLFDLYDNLTKSIEIETIGYEKKPAFATISNLMLKSAFYANNMIDTLKNVEKNLENQTTETTEQAEKKAKALEDVAGMIEDYQSIADAFNTKDGIKKAYDSIENDLFEFINLEKEKLALLNKKDKTEDEQKRLAYLDYHLEESEAIYGRDAVTVENGIHKYNSHLNLQLSPTEILNANQMTERQKTFFKLGQAITNRKLMLDHISENNIDRINDLFESNRINIVDEDFFEMLSSEDTDALSDLDSFLNNAVNMLSNKESLIDLSQNDLISMKTLLDKLPDLSELTSDPTRPVTQNIIDNYNELQELLSGKKPIGNEKLINDLKTDPYGVIKYNLFTAPIDQALALKNQFESNPSEFDDIARIEGLLKDINKRLSVVSDYDSNLLTGPKSFSKIINELQDLHKFLEDAKEKVLSNLENKSKQDELLERAINEDLANTFEDIDITNAIDSIIKQTNSKQSLSELVKQITEKGSVFYEIIIKYIKNGSIESISDLMNTIIKSNENNRASIKYNANQLSFHKTAYNEVFLKRNQNIVDNLHKFNALRNLNPFFNLILGISNNDNPIRRYLDHGDLNKLEMELTNISDTERKAIKVSDEDFITIQNIVNNFNRLRRNTNLSNDINSDYDYSKVIAEEVSIATDKTSKYAPTRDQRNKIHHIIKWFTRPFTELNHNFSSLDDVLNGSLMIKGFAGTGKSVFVAPYAVKILSKLGKLNMNNVAIMSINDTLVDSLVSNIGLKDKGDLNENTELLIFDEFAYLNHSSITEFVERLNRVNEARQAKGLSKVKVLLLGDTNQISKDPINTKKYLEKTSLDMIVEESGPKITQTTSNIEVVPTLTISYRSNVGVINSSANQFKGSTSMDIKAVAQASGDMLLDKSPKGIHTATSLQEIANQIKFLISENPNMKFTLIYPYKTDISESAEEINIANKFVNDNNLSDNVEIKSPEEVQGRTIDNIIYLNSNFETSDSFIARDYNTEMYTVLSRASNYALILDSRDNPRFNQLSSNPAIAKTTAINKDNIEKNKKEYTSKVIEDKSTYNSEFTKKTPIIKEEIVEEEEIEEDIIEELEVIIEEPVTKIAPETTTIETKSKESSLYESVETEEELDYDEEDIVDSEDKSNVDYDFIEPEQETIEPTTKLPDEMIVEYPRSKGFKDILPDGATKIALYQTSKDGNPIKLVGVFAENEDGNFTLVGTLSKEQVEELDLTDRFNELADNEFLSPVLKETDFSLDRSTIDKTQFDIPVTINKANSFKINYDDKIRDRFLDVFDNVIRSLKLENPRFKLHIYKRSELKNMPEAVKAGMIYLELESDNMPVIRLQMNPKFIRESGKKFAFSDKTGLVAYDNSQEVIEFLDAVKEFETDGFKLGMPIFREVFIKLSQNIVDVSNGSLEFLETSRRDNLNSDLLSEDQLINMLDRYDSDSEFRRNVQTIVKATNSVKESNININLYDSRDTYGMSETYDHFVNKIKNSITDSIKKAIVNNKLDMNMFKTILAAEENFNIPISQMNSLFENIKSLNHVSLNSLIESGNFEKAIDYILSGHATRMSHVNKAISDNIITKDQIDGFKNLLDIVRVLSTDNATAILGEKDGNEYGFFYEEKGKRKGFVLKEFDGENYNPVKTYRLSSVNSPLRRTLSNYIRANQSESKGFRPFIRQSKIDGRNITQIADPLNGSQSDYDNGTAVTSEVIDRLMYGNSYNNLDRVSVNRVFETAIDSNTALNEEQQQLFDQLTTKVSGASPTSLVIGFEKAVKTPTGEIITDESTPIVEEIKEVDEITALVTPSDDIFDIENDYLFGMPMDRSDSEDLILGRTISEQESIDYLKRMFPQADNHLFKFFDKLFSLKSNKPVWGRFVNGAIHLLRNDDNTIYKTTVKHEAFHKIFREYLAPKHKTTLFKAYLSTLSQQDIERLSAMSMADRMDFVEEGLAEMFAQREEKPIQNKVLRYIHNIFRKMLLTFFSDGQRKLNSYFDLIDNFAFSKQIAPSFSTADRKNNILKYFGDTKTYQQVEQYVLSKYKMLYEKGDIRPDVKGASMSEGEINTMIMSVMANEKLQYQKVVKALNQLKAMPQDQIMNGKPVSEFVKHYEKLLDSMKTISPILDILEKTGTNKKMYEEILKNLYPQSKVFLFAESKGVYSIEEDNQIQQDIEDENNSDELDTTEDPSNEIMDEAEEQISQKVEGSFEQNSDSHNAMDKIFAKVKRFTDSISYEGKLVPRRAAFKIMADFVRGLNSNTSDSRTTVTNFNNQLKVLLKAENSNLTWNELIKQGKEIGAVVKAFVDIYESANAISIDGITVPKNLDARSHNRVIEIVINNKPIERHNMDNRTYYELVRNTIINDETFKPFLNALGVDNLQNFLSKLSMREQHRNDFIELFSTFSTLKESEFIYDEFVEDFGNVSMKVFNAASSDKSYVVRTNMKASITRKLNSPEAITKTVDKFKTLFESFPSNYDNLSIEQRETIAMPIFNEFKKYFGIHMGSVGVYSEHSKTYDYAVRSIKYLMVDHLNTAYEKALKAIDSDTQEQVDIFYLVTNLLNDEGSNLDNITTALSGLAVNKFNTSIKDASGKKRYAIATDSNGYKAIVGLINRLKGIKTFLPSYLNKDNNQTNFFKQNPLIASKKYLSRYLTHNAITTKNGYSKDTLVSFTDEDFNKMFERMFGAQFLDMIASAGERDVQYYQNVYIKSNRPDTNAGLMKVLGRKDLDYFFEQQFEQILSQNFEQDGKLKGYKLNNFTGASVLKNALKANLTTEEFDSLFKDVDKARSLFNTHKQNILNNIYEQLDKDAQQIAESFILNQARLPQNFRKSIDNALSHDLISEKEHSDMIQALNNAEFGDKINQSKKNVIKNTTEMFLPMMKLFAYNHAVNGYFLTQIAAGNFNYYGDSIALVKRLSLVYAPGTAPTINDNFGLKEKSKILIVDDVTFSKESSVNFMKGVVEGISNEDLSIIAKQMLRNKQIDQDLYDTFERTPDATRAKIVEIVTNKYGGKPVDLADAQGFITPERHAALVKGYGDSYNLGNIGKPSWFDIKPDGTPTAVKYSWVVLTDEMCERSEELSKARDFMRKHGAEELAFSSAVKVGLPSVKINGEQALITWDDIQGNVDDRVNHSIIEMQNQNYRMQLNPMHGAETNAVTNPSQLTYFLNILEDNTKQADVVYNALEKLYKQGASVVNNKVLNKDGSLNKQNLINLVKAKFENSDVDSPLGVALEEGISMNMPLIADKALRQISSVYNKNTVSVKFNGGKFVLQSALGHKNHKGQDLEYRRINGRMVAECLISKGTLYNMYGKKIADQMIERINNGDDTPMFKNGDSMGFRIPSSEIHSGISLKIVGFYDNSSDNGIIVPARVVQLHGSDFDVDSLFTLFRHNPDKFYAYDEANKRYYLKNYSQTAIEQFSKKDYEDYYKNVIIEEMLDVFSNDVNVIRMFSPISMDNIGDIRSEIMKELGDTKGKETDLSRLGDYFDTHQSSFNGAAGTGIFANGVKALAYMIRSGKTEDGKITVPSINFSKLAKHVIKVNGVELNQLSNVADTYEILDSLLNAAIDNVKEQLLPYFGLSGNTIPAFISMLSSADKDGNPMSPEYAFRFIKQPVIDMISKQKGSREAGVKLANNVLLDLNQKIHGTIDATNFLKEDHLALLDNIYPDGLSTELMRDGLINGKKYVDLRELLNKDSLTKEDIDLINLQTRVYADFLAFRELGNQLSVIASFCNITRNMPSSREDIENFRNKLNKIVTKVDGVEQINPDLAYVIPGFFETNPHIEQAVETFKSLESVTEKAIVKHNPKFKGIFKEVGKLARLGKSQEEDFKLRNAFMEFLISGVEWEPSFSYEKLPEQKFSFKYLNKRKDLGPQQKSGVLTHKEAFAKLFGERLIELKNYLQQRNISNGFLEQIVINMNNRGTYEIQMPNATNMDNIDMINMQSEFEKLFEYEVDYISGDGLNNIYEVRKSNSLEYSQLMKDFVRYGVNEFGLNFGAMNFSKVLPHRLYKPVSDKFQELLDKIESKSEEELSNIAEDFALQYAMVNPSAFSTIKDSNYKTVYPIKDGSGVTNDIWHDYTYDIPSDEDGKPTIELPTINVIKGTDWSTITRLVGYEDNKARYRIESYQTKNKSYSFNIDNLESKSKSIDYSKLKLILLPNISKEDLSKGEFTLPTRKELIVPEGFRVLISEYSDITRRNAKVFNVINLTENSITLSDKNISKLDNNSSLGIEDSNIDETLNQCK